MSAGSIVGRGRAAAEERMLDTCKAIAPGTDPPVYDPATDTYTYPDGSTIYEGPCQVRPATIQDLEADAGAATVSTRAYVVKLPITATTVRRNHVIEVLASQLDPGLPGTRMRVLGALKGTQITARRLACEEVTS